MYKISNTIMTKDSHKKIHHDCHSLAMIPHVPSAKHPERCNLCTYLHFS